MSKRKKHDPRIPLPVYGGIRSQGTRSDAKRPWWSQRWLLMLERLRLGARLGRGRNYAATGQILDLTLTKGSVQALVQGGADTPYAIDLTFRTLPPAAAKSLSELLHHHPVLLGHLLVNDLPMELEEHFQRLATPLFPLQRHDLDSRCSCPDWARPCKHAAAVLFLLGEAIEYDPFLLLALRGLRREDVLPAPSKSRPTKPTPTALSIGNSGDPAQFWGDALVPATDLGPAPEHKLPVPLMARLGALPFWRGHERFRQFLEQAADRSTAHGLCLWSGAPYSSWRPIKAAAPEPEFNLRRQRLRVESVF